MQRKTRALLKEFKRAVESTPDKPTSVIAKELGVTPQRLYQIKHTYMKDMKRAIKKKDYGLTKVHGVTKATISPLDYLGFNPTIIRGEPDDFVQFRELRAEHETLTKDYVELHDKHRELLKKYEEAGMLANKYQKEALDMQAIVKYLEGKVGA
jgi:hypothetical protein